MSARCVSAGTSKHAKRRAKEKEKGTLAQRTAPGEVRLLNRGSAQPAAGDLPAFIACRATFLAKGCWLLIPSFSSVARLQCRFLAE